MLFILFIFASPFEPPADRTFENETAEPCSAACDGQIGFFDGMNRVFWHGAIVVDWPRLIHAFAERGCVCWGDGEQDRLKEHRPLVFISAF